jgi:hypothetical protein
MMHEINKMQRAIQVFLFASASMQRKKRHDRKGVSPQVAA